MLIAFEALAWGRHVNRVHEAWDLVRRADHPAVTLAVDTFHLLSRGDDGSALTGVPGDRIGFLQVADAPLLDMNVLDWSRHFRCFPGEGGLDVAGVVAATLAAGYTGPLSLEVFSDVVREADPATTSRDAMRSLVHLEDLVARSLPARTIPWSPPVPLTVQPPSPPASTPPSRDTGAPGVPALLTSLGFAVAGRHRSKPVTWWRSRDAHVVVNDDPTAGPALGCGRDPVGAVADRAKALLWPGVARTRGAGEARLPGITSPSGLHVFLSAEPGDSDDWQGDFDTAEGRPKRSRVGPSPGPHRRRGPRPAPERGGVVPAARSSRWSPARLEEFIEPQGRLRSRAFRPPAGDLRVVLNVLEVPDEAPGGITQVAFACSDVRAQVRGLRAVGVAADDGARQLLRRPRRPLRAGPRASSPTCASTSCSTTGSGTASSCTPSPSRSPPASTSSSSSVAAGTTGTDPPGPTSGWPRREPLALSSRGGARRSSPRVPWRLPRWT